MPCQAILFDLLTGLLDSWTLWNAVAGSEADGRRWRAAYLRLTYGCGGYPPNETLGAPAPRAGRPAPTRPHAPAAPSDAPPPSAHGSRVPVRPGLPLLLAHP